jgi:mono/diheme cytochrome c family protein
MKWHIAIGTISLVVIVGLLAIVAVGEQERMQTFTIGFESRQIEAGAALFESNCRTCHGPLGGGIEGVAPVINALELFDGTRLTNIGFTGTVEDYLGGVLAAGRPVPSEGTNYPQRMPGWSQEYGGPLADHQIAALVAFIMNWEDRALAGDEEPVVTGESVGTDFTVNLPEGDPENGEALANGSSGCAGCHILSATGPAWLPDGDQAGIGQRAANRIEEAGYTGTAATAEEYLFESTVLTNVHIVEGYQPNIMPGNYGDRLSPQDMADLLAFMLSLQ